MESGLSAEDLAAFETHFIAFVSNTRTDFDDSLLDEFMLDECTLDNDTLDDSALNYNRM